MGKSGMGKRQGTGRRQEARKDRGAGVATRGQGSLLRKCGGDPGRRVLPFGRLADATLEPGSNGFSWYLLGVGQELRNERSRTVLVDPRKQNLTECGKFTVVEQSQDQMKAPNWSSAAGRFNTTRMMFPFSTARHTQAEFMAIGLFTIYGCIRIPLTIQRGLNERL